VDYHWKISKTSILGQTEINSEFGKIYKDKLNK
jgi:hypothetical protein